MFETDSDLDPAETVSSLALDVIDELRMKMLECLLVVQTLRDEADLNFTDLANDILAAHRSTLEAYQAASIVHQGAELDERWGNGLSRPKAVFARHNAAVRQGATKVTPMPALCDRLERHLYQLPRPDRTQTIAGQRPDVRGWSSPPAKTASTQRSTWGLECLAPIAIYTPRPPSVNSIEYTMKKMMPARREPIMTSAISSVR